ncbi:lipoxygenase 3 [Euphorbia peplus]|nr:lipoxygenase 3 [Euphorbia peplus]
MAGSMEVLSSSCSNSMLKNNFRSPVFARAKWKNVSFTNYRRMQVMMKKVVAAQLVDYDKSMALDQSSAEKTQKLKMTALVTVKISSNFRLMEFLPAIRNPSKNCVALQLLSNELHSNTMKPKLSQIEALDLFKNYKIGGEKMLDTYKMEFTLDSDFGTPGAVTVTNNYHNEFYLESINIEGVVNFDCNSWIQPANDVIGQHKRIFFTSKAYLPCDTPSGLKQVREIELNQIRGSGKGTRRFSDRVFGYDMYNDLGNPDTNIEYARPVLRGPNLPYPRRCRTGRPPNITDETTESPANVFMPMYVPRDEVFDDSKRESLDAGKFKWMLNNLLPTLSNIPFTSCDSIKKFSDINCLYKNTKDKTGPGLGAKSHTEWSMLSPEILKFDLPDAVSRDGSFYLRDDELGRLALAGMNPVSIERLEVFPPQSKLNPSIYGPLESAITEEHITPHLQGMSVQQALEENKLFMLDYHDVYLPFLEQMNNLGDRKAYATREIFFLTPSQTLMPIAIELSLPSADTTHPAKQVFTPPTDATSNWLWQLAKAHVSSNDAGAHQLVNHWLRTHACIEPFIIAAHRQLSTMHPIYKLLHPHMRYTLQINAEARESLINAGGIIESFFSTAKYSMDISSAAYRNWRFDMEGLPADLIRRGMATPDPTQPCGIRLVIEDYPYASDGLLIWSSIEELVGAYVNHYYTSTSEIISDSELQSWYEESINSGHPDHRDAKWWPQLSTPDDLTSILTTIIWIVSAQHAAVNFGQYPYGAYVPIRPPLMRKLMPIEHDLEYENFLKDPEKHYLSSLPSLLQATNYMSVLSILSTHEEEEEYLGNRRELSTWSGEPEIIEAFYKFSVELKRIEKEIERRNADSSLKNRCGAGVPPYELLMPSSDSGISFRGVPNSVSI